MPIASLAHAVLNVGAHVNTPFRLAPMLALSLVASMALEGSATACVQESHELDEPGCSVYEQNCDPTDTAPVTQETPYNESLASESLVNPTPPAPTPTVSRTSGHGPGAFWALGGAMVFGIGIFRARGKSRSGRS